MAEATVSMLATHSAINMGGVTSSSLYTSVNHRKGPHSEVNSIETPECGATRGNSAYTYETRNDMCSKVLATVTGKMNKRWKRRTWWTCWILGSVWYTIRMCMAIADLQVLVANDCAATRISRDISLLVSQENGIAQDSLQASTMRTYHTGTSTKYRPIEVLRSMFILLSWFVDTRGVAWNYRSDCCSDTRLPSDTIPQRNPQCTGYK